MEASPDDGAPGPWALLGYVLLLLFTAALTATSGSALWWMVRAWRTPESLEESSFGTATTDHRFSFSLIVPARHEEQVLETTLEHLASMTYPSFEVLVVVGHDDPGTAAVAESC